MSVTNDERFRRKPKLHKLIFGEDDPKYPGLHVVLKAPPVDQYLQLLELAAELLELKLDKVGPADIAKIGKLFKAFAGSLREWNLDDEDGEPVPPTYEGVASNDPDFVLDLFQAWIEAVGKVAPPLNGASSSGANSGLEASIPMEPISASLSS